VRADHGPDRPSVPGARDDRGATDHPRQTKITDAGIPYRIPADDELGARLTEVLAVIYLLLNEGYLSTAERAHSRDLVDDAEWLASLLHQLMPTEPEVAGLLALIRLHRARAAARFDLDGALSPVTRLHRAIALRYTSGPRAAMTELDTLAGALDREEQLLIGGGRLAWMTLIGPGLGTRIQPRCANKHRSSLAVCSRPPPNSNSGEGLTISYGSAAMSRPWPVLSPGARTEMGIPRAAQSSSARSAAARWAPSRSTGR
jgi:hypothetical protein